MKKWNVFLQNEKNGKSGLLCYYGYDTKKEATEFAERAEKLTAGIKATVVKTR